MLIYKITNKINGKVYIGQTTRTMKRRWKGHCNSATLNKSNNLFHSAIHKYGPDAFIVEQIAFASSKDELNIMEKQYIEQYNSLHPNGYNLKTGGDQCTYSDFSKEKMSNAKIGTLVSEEVREKMSQSHIERWKDLSLREQRSLISKAMWKDKNYKNKITKARKKYWSDEDKRKIASERATEMAKDSEYIKKVSDGVKRSLLNSDTKNKLKKFYSSREKPVICSNGEIYKSISSAAEILGVRSSSIVKNIKGTNKTTRGYTFKYLENNLHDSILYIVAGAPASGKSWTCKQFPESLYVSYDESDKLSHRFEILKTAYRHGVVLFDPYVGVSTTIEQYKDILQTCLIVIDEDDTVLKQRLIDRGGEISDSYDSRVKRMRTLAKNAEFSGTSSEVLEYLRNKLSSV